jgi:hypothetical protein
MGNALRIAGAFAFVLASGCGQAQTESPACGDTGPRPVELDEDLGGFTIESLARDRSGRGTLTEPDRPSIAFTIETTAIGPATATRLVGCGGETLEVESAAEIRLQSDDGRIDLTFEGTLHRELDSGTELDAPTIALADLDPDAQVPVSPALADQRTGLGFDLSGFDGRGRLWWHLSGLAPEVTIADLELPYALDEDDFGR